MSTRKSPENRWEEIMFTRHSEVRMEAVGFTKERALQALQSSEPVLLPPQIAEYKNEKYTPECQQKISYWRFGSILFTVCEEPDGRIVLLTVTDQHLEVRSFNRRKSSKLRPHPPDEEFRAYPYREENKWR
jgi:hypothetical protein